jgi:hypothetical protein
MNKIILAIKHLSAQSVASVARSQSRRSKSTTFSQRATSAADAAALQVQMEALRLQNSRQQELERLLFEEETRRQEEERKAEMRRKEADLRMASLKRQMEEEKLAAQL